MKEINNRNALLWVGGNFYYCVSLAPDPINPSITATALTTQAATTLGEAEAMNPTYCQAFLKKK